MFLTADELKALTKRGTKAGQRDWLASNGYPHDINAAGWPVVLRAYVEKRLGGAVQSAKPASGWKPNLEPALKKAS